jgi:cytochrome c oxidase subunit 2
MHLQAKRLLKLALSPVLMILSMLGTAAWAEEAQRWQINLEPGVTDLGAKIYDLHMTVFWVCVWIGVVVFGLMLYSIITHRKSLGAKPADFHESTSVEIAWTVVPFIILIVIAFPATTTLLEVYDTDEADLDVTCVLAKLKFITKIPKASTTY